MPQFAQIDNGVVTGLLTANAAPKVLPSGRSFLDVSNRVDVVLLATYDVSSDTFTPPALAPLAANPIDAKLAEILTEVKRRP